MKTLFAVGPAVVLLLSITGTPIFAQTPSQCAAAAAQARANPALGISGYIGSDNRLSAIAHIEGARSAAAAGNEAECWHQLRLSDMFVETSAPLQPKAATQSADAPTGR